MSVTEEQLKQPPARSPARPQPQWGKMALMKELGFEEGAEGLPLFDCSIICEYLDEGQQELFLASLANLLRDLSECMSSQEKMDIAPSISKFRNSLEAYNALRY